MEEEKETCLDKLVSISAATVMAASKFGTNNMKAWIHPDLYQRGWWCNGVWNIFLAHFGPLLVILHLSQSEYCPSTMCPFPYGCFQQDKLNMS